MANQYLFQDSRSAKGLMGIETLVLIGLFLTESKLTEKLLGSPDAPKYVRDTFPQFLMANLNDAATPTAAQSLIQHWNQKDEDTHDTLQAFLAFIDNNRKAIDDLRNAFTASKKKEMGSAYDDCPIPPAGLLQLIEAARVIQWRGKIR